MSAEDLRVIAEARTQIGVPENAEATPAQTLELLRAVPAEVAERMILDWREMARQGADCWMRNHEQTIEYWRTCALEAAALLPVVREIAADEIERIADERTWMTVGPSPAEEARRERYLRIADDLIQRGIDAESAEAACAYHYAAHKILDVGREVGR